LLEVIIAIGLIGALMTAMVTFFWQSARAREQAGRDADRTQVARQVLDTIAAELRGCLGLESLGLSVYVGDLSGSDGVPRLIGDRRSISFLTTQLPAEHQYVFYRESEEPPPAQHDLRLVSYKLWVDEEQTTEDGEPLVGGLLKVTQKTFNQALVDEEDPLRLRTDLWSHEIGYIEFRYFDGVEWDTVWDVTQGNALPQLIQVTVGFGSITRFELEDQDLQEYPLDEYPLGDDQYHPDRYSTIIKLPAADKFFSSRVQRLGKQLSEQLGVEGAP